MKEFAISIVTGTEAVMALRLIVAALLGALIGYEREYMGKAAGLRTYAIVSVGACLFTLVSIYGVEQLPSFVAPEISSGNFNVNYDPTRIASNIVTGIGFLGAGLIILRGSRLEGLTTAAGLWVAAAVGTAVGFGYYIVSGVTVLIVLVILLFLTKVEPSHKETKTQEDDEHE